LATPLVSYPPEEKINRRYPFLLGFATWKGPTGHPGLHVTNRESDFQSEHFLIGIRSLCREKIQGSLKDQARTTKEKGSLRNSISVRTEWGLEAV